MLHLTELKFCEVFSCCVKHLQIIPPPFFYDPTYTCNKAGMEFLQQNTVHKGNVIITTCAIEIEDLPVLLDPTICRPRIFVVDKM